MHCRSNVELVNKRRHLDSSAIGDFTRSAEVAARGLAPQDSGIGGPGKRCSR